MKLAQRVARKFLKKAGWWPMSPTGGIDWDNSGPGLVNAIPCSEQDQAKLVHGDGPADIWGGALDRVEEQYQSAWGRKPFIEEVQGGLNFSFNTDMLEDYYGYQWAKDMKTAKDLPKKVEDLVKEIKEDNPSYDDAKAWATAWSVFCKHVDNGSPHCKRPESGYLTKQATVEAVSPNDAAFRAHRLAKQAGLSRREAFLTARRSAAFKAYREVGELRDRLENVILAALPVLGQGEYLLGEEDHHRFGGWEDADRAQELLTRVQS